MKRNVGKRDRVIFLIVGLLILALGIIYQSWWGLIGLLPVIVAASGRCALFCLFKIDTTKKDSVQE
jgi:hypothetical protein